MRYQRIKRVMDIVGALVGLLALAPFVPIIGAFIKLETAGPIFVSLPRVSQGKAVSIYKFRSMVRDAHAMKQSLRHLNERNDGSFFKITHDPRITRVGRFLRRTRIDEFPQLWNVLTGELALVGPRPHEPEEVTAYPGRFAHLPQAKAGVTGLSQIRGASSLSFLKELEFDSYYLAHQNLWLDCAILAKTLAIFLTDHTAV